MSSSSGFVPPLSVLLGGGERRPGVGGSVDARVRELLRGWGRDAGLAERLGGVLEVGDLLSGCSVGVLPEALVWLRDLRGHEEPQVRLAAGMALARGVEAEGPGVALEVLNGAAGLEVWRDVPWVGAMPEELVEMLGGTGAAVVRWVADVCDVDARTELSAALAGHSDGDRRIGAVQVAAKVLARWRSPRDVLLPVLGERVTDPVPAVRVYATHLLAVLGGDADLLAGRVDDPYERVRDIAAWGLARQRDSRCLDHFVERMSAYGSAANYSTGTPYGYSTALPSLYEVLAPLGGHAADLLPVVRHELRGGGRLAYSLAGVVGEWGEAAVEAMPELLGLVGTEAHLPAVKALGRIGSAEAVPVLERMVGRPPERPTVWETSWSRLVVAWAYWKAGGDPEPVLAELDVAFRGRYGQALWPYFDDLGPLAGAFADRLRESLERRDALTRIGAAYSLFRVTGDPEEAFPVLWEVAYPFVAGSFGEAGWEALCRVGEMGLIPERIRPALRELLAGDRRLCCHGGWRAVEEDRKVRELFAVRQL